MEGPGYDLDRWIQVRQWQGGGGVCLEGPGEGWTGRGFHLSNNKKVFDAEIFAIYQALGISQASQESKGYLSRLVWRKGPLVQQPLPVLSQLASYEAGREVGKRVGK